MATDTYTHSLTHKMTFMHVLRLNYVHTDMMPRSSDLILYKQSSYKIIQLTKESKSSPSMLRRSCLYSLPNSKHIHKYYISSNSLHGRICSTFIIKLFIFPILNIMLLQSKQRNTCCIFQTAFFRLQY